MLLSPLELHDRLIAAGQPLEDDDRGEIPTVVRRMPETTISVALNLDPTVMPAYRGRYFACLLKSEEERTPALCDDPAFALPERFRRIEEGRTSGYGFLDGPFRWLLPRLIGFGEILLWPEDRTAAPARGPVPSTAGAVRLDLGQDEDCRALWDVATGIADGFDNVFVSDPGCGEVAVLHHHDKIVLSIPDQARRRAVLDDLGRWSDLIEDCSGYSAEWDDEARS